MNYTTLATTEKEYKAIIKALEKGYKDKEGHKHFPKEQIAFAIKLEKVTGCRISDVVRLTPNSFVKDGDHYRINIKEKKTGKSRKFTVTEKTYKQIMAYCEEHDIQPNQRIVDLTERAIQYQIKQVCDYLGYSNISTHSFRKMAGTAIYEATDHDIVAVQQFLQHTSPATTSRYLTQSSRNLEKALANIEM